jgi:Fe2+ or Zn2+ uptake regulation protein
VLRGITERHGFAVEHERLDFYGLCASCRRATRGTLGGSIAPHR